MIIGTIPNDFWWGFALVLIVWTVLAIGEGRYRD